MYWALGLLALGFVLWPFLAEALRKPMDPVLRAEASGSFVELAGGVTHYRWDGPEGGPVVVLVHGLSSPSQVWDAVIPGIVGLGFRVLRYDHYGRGYSDRLTSGMSDQRYLDQLDELLSSQGVEGRVSLIGYSMGGQIATDFTAKDPGRIQHLCLIAPAGMLTHFSGADRLARDLWGFGEWYCRGFGALRFRKELESMDAGTYLPTLRETLIAETKTRGHAPAMLADRRDVLRFPDIAEHKRIARASVPVGAVFGSGDTVIPPHAADLLADWNAEAKITMVNGAGHGLPYTHPDQVVRAFADLTDDYL
ncbi:MAG: alpha/beta hydrolase [Dinoroseobacter sp.]|nr:alpha/beta hydrolase [Dinoroseobacter sp.]